MSSDRFARSPSPAELERRDREYDRGGHRRRSPPPRYRRSPSPYRRSPPPRRYDRYDDRRRRSPSPYKRSYSPPRRDPSGSPPAARKRRNKWDTPTDAPPAAAAAGVAVGAPSAAQAAIAGAAALAAAMAMGGNPLLAPPVVGRKQRELYVGNLAVGQVTADLVKEFFSGVLASSQGFNPSLGPAVANVQLSGEGKFGFVEFRDEVMAATALQLDKVELLGRPMNVGRPQGYINAGAPPPPLPLPPEWRPAAPTIGTLDPAAAAAAALAAASSFAAAAGATFGGAAGCATAGGISGLIGLTLPSGAPPAAGRKQRELYVGNLPIGAVTAADLRELFSAPLRTMAGFDETLGPPVLNVDVAADGKFAFVEFRDEALCTLALNTFDKMELLGRSLKVGRPRGYIEPSASGLASLAPAAMASRLAAVSPLLAHPLLAPAPTTPPTACLRLDGLITPDMLNDEEYSDVLSDIREECERSGRVTAVRVPRVGEPDVGAAFVRFASVVEAVCAREALDRRVFDGNKVAARFVPEGSL